MALTLRGSLQAPAGPGGGGTDGRRARSGRERKARPRPGAGSLARSHGGRAGREGCWRGGRAPRRPAPWARGGAGSALGGPPSPAAAAAAPLRL